MKKKIGFTLIEILIVMLIISIVAGIAVITINTNQRKQYETLTNQLVNAIRLAEQEAMLRPATLALGFSTQSFQFYTLERDEKTNENKWVMINKAPLNRHTLPSHAQITLKIRGNNTTDDEQTKLIITPSNDLSPFVILIGKQNENPYYQIKGQANGEVSSEPIQTD